MRKNAVYFFPLLIILSFIFHKTFADMQGGSYKIRNDSINFGGAESSSGNYRLNDSVGEIATGLSNSTSYYMNAGFWQMQESYIAISSPSDLNLGSIGGIAGESAEGTTSWTVTTDNTAGYAFSIAASTSPALRSSLDSFEDYAPSGANPDYSFSNPSSSSSFGISPEGTDLAARFKDNGTSCNSGSLDTTGKCWDGLSISPKSIFSSGSSNHPLGSENTVRFRAESGSSHIQTAGAYQAIITVTALAL